MSLALLAETTADGWRPGIGDPTIFGWLTTAAYVAAAGLCAHAWRRERLAAQMAPVGFRPRFWLLLTVAMAALGLNKQLDLQSLFTQIGRDLAKSQGWYSERRQVQLLFIIFLGALGAATIACTWWALRGSFRRYRLALCGIAYLAVFVLIRAASFHHMDAFLYRTPLAGPWMNRALELGGITFVAICARRASRLEG